MNVLVEVNAAVRKLAELSSLLDLCNADELSATHVLLRLVCAPNPPSSKPLHNVSSFILSISSFHLSNPDRIIPVA